MKDLALTRNQQESAGNNTLISYWGRGASYGKMGDRMRAGQDYDIAKRLET